MNGENTDWLNKFRLRHGRNPTVLHIGNIANNAYNNAKLLNQAGLDCDVICYDYYHTMACPEWEDADFQFEFENDNKPDWHSVDLKDFERPRWFAQGNLKSCILYLIAKRDGALNEAESLWQQLKLQSGLKIESKKLETLLAFEKVRLSNFSSRLHRLVITLILSNPLSAAGILSSVLENRLTKMLFLPGLATSLVGLLLLRIIAFPFKTKIGQLESSLENNIIQTLKSWKDEFPDRSDSMRREDILPYNTVLPEWTALMGRYDLIVGYSTDPLLPMLAGKPYFALEHGTIREIPYSKSSIGRLCALSYRKAKHVFVTNFDCVESAKTLAPKRYTVINHPYDEDHGLRISGAKELRETLLRELDSSFLIFHPTRHDWVSGTGYADKSNDTLLRALINLRHQGLKVGLVLCSWGKNVAESKTLLSDGDLSRHVKWISPLPITPFERMCQACDIVADQFMLGAFGGVCFKAMAVGAPILTYLNEELVLGQYPVVPPVINCRTTTDITTKLSELSNQPDVLLKMGLAARDWMKSHHGKRDTVDAQFDQFRKFFDEGTT